MAKRRAVNDLRHGCLGPLLDVDKNRAPQTAISATEGRYSSPRDGCRPHIGLIDDAIQKDLSPENYFILNGPDGGRLHVCQAFHHYVFCPGGDKRKLGDIVKMHAVMLPSFYVFTVNWYVQLSRAEYLGYGNLRCHIYLIGPGRTLHNSIIWEYNRILGIADDNDSGEGTEVVSVDVKIVKL